MTHESKLEQILESLPPKYLPLIAADFAEAVLPIYEAYNKDSSVIIEAIAAARSGDKARAEAAGNAAHAAAHATACAAVATEVVYAVAAAARTADFAATASAYNSPKGETTMKKRQIEIVKGWIAKIKAEEPVLMAFYDTIDFE